MRSSIFVTLALLLPFGGVASAKFLRFLQCSGIPTQIGHGRMGNEDCQWSYLHSRIEVWCRKQQYRGDYFSCTIRESDSVRPRLFIQGESRLSRAGHIHSTSVGYPHEDARNL